MTKNASAASSNKLTAADLARVHAYCHLELADYRAALNPARTAVRLSPDHAPSEALLALALRGINKPHEAIVHAEKAHNLAPKQAEYAFVYGLCLWQSHPDKEALNLMETALQKMPKRYDLRLDYAGCLLQQQKFDQVMEQVELLEKQIPEHAKLKLLRRCAKDRVWDNKIEILASYPPLPLPAKTSSTYLTIGETHLRENCFELTMNKCSRALDLDENCEQAKSLYATAHYLMEHDMAALSHEFSDKMRREYNKVIFLILPVILALWGAYSFINSDELRNAIVCLVLLAIYLLIYFSLLWGGRTRRKAKDFEEIVRAEHLTPQGRRQQSKPALDEFDQVIESEQTVIPVDSHDNYTEMSKQLERSSNRLRAISATFSAVALLSMFILICTIILQNTETFMTDKLIRIIGRISGISVLVFALLAFMRRRKASIIAERAAQSLNSEGGRQ